ncbi:MAG: pentapeptide repeat-containing protein [Akkermansiaceae bacterium]|jgi:uncharacterized protein YjbI with pentapeptide repeats
MTSPHICVGRKLGAIIKEIPSSIEYSSPAWVDCEFNDTNLEGANLDNHIFTRCHFEKVDFYWCYAFRATFIDCKFVNCDLRGSFAETRFIRCGFVNCQVGDNNLGGKTEWRNALAIECVIAGNPLPIIEFPSRHLD